MRTRAPWSLAGLALGLLAGCANGGHDVAAEPTIRSCGWRTASPRRRRPTTLAASTTIAAPAVTEAPTTTAPPLPVPSRRPRPRRPRPQVGTIDIPKIGLSLPLFYGVNLATLDEGGAGLWPGTACLASSATPWSPRTG